MVSTLERLAQLDAERSSVLLRALREHEETVSALATRVSQLEAELRRVREESIGSSNDVGSNVSTPRIVIRFLFLHVSM